MTIGGVPATDVVVTPTLIIFAIPPGTAGAKDVVVTNTDGQKGTLRGGYTYNPFPVIEEIEPDFGGPIAGGTAITITGSNFMQGVIVVIGGERVQRLDFFSPTELRLKTPPGTVGKKDVRVVNPDGQESVLKEGFTYNPAPTIASVSPNMGPLEGGTEITIIGTGFLGQADVIIGGTEASRSVVSPTTGGTKILITGTGFLLGAKVVIGKRPAMAELRDETTLEAVTPPNPQGTFDVRVINPDTQEAVKHQSFISIGELVYNFPNPFRAEQGTTFRYVTNEKVESIKVQVFNLAGGPIGVVGRSGSNEVRWYDPSVHAGLYVYRVDVTLEGGKVKSFKRALEVYK